MEGARPAAGAPGADHVRGHLERPARAAPPAARGAAHRRANRVGRAVAVLHRPVVRVAGDDGRGARGRGVVHRRRADAVQRRQLARGGHHARGVAHRQIRRARRHHGRGRHTGHARLRVRGRQPGPGRRVRGLRVPGLGRIGHGVRVRRRRRGPNAAVDRRAAAVPEGDAHRRPDRRAAQLLPRADQTAPGPQQADPLPGHPGVRAAHLRPAGGSVL